MDQKEAFEIVMKAMEEKIKELKKEIETEYNYILKRRALEEIKSYEESIEYLQDVMYDLNIK